MTARLAALLPVLAALAGCGGASYVLVSEEELCKSWRHQTVSKHDVLTERTAAGIEGNNEARPAWGCQHGKNRARQP
jgi:hypothetical protein